MVLDFLDLSGNAFTHLDLTGTTFGRGFRGVRADSDEVIELTLDDVIFRSPKLSDLMKRTSALARASIVGLKLTRRHDLPSLLEIESLTDITVDQGLVDIFPEGFEAFEAQDTTTLTIVLYGDTNKDQQVDFSDFQVLATNFGQPGRWSDGDFDRDEEVGFSDFLLLASNFESEPVQNVPEPNGLPYLLGWWLIALRAASRCLGHLGIADSVNDRRLSGFAHECVVCANAWPVSQQRVAATRTFVGASARVV